MSDLRLLYGNAQHRPLVEAVARLGGLTVSPASVADSNGRIDPLELVRQRAAADFARELILHLGWSLELQPPKEPPVKPQAFADTDGGTHAS